MSGWTRQDLTNSYAVTCLGGAFTGLQVLINQAIIFRKSTKAKSTVPPTSFDQLFNVMVPTLVNGEVRYS